MSRIATQGRKDPQEVQAGAGWAHENGGTELGGEAGEDRLLRRTPAQLTENSLGPALGGFALHLGLAEVKVQETPAIAPDSLLHTKVGISIGSFVDVVPLRNRGRFG